MVVSRGFQGRPPAEPERLPPGQYLTRDFPVLATGPTPIDAADDWSLGIRGAVEAPRTWSWEELLALPSETFTVDIHCVTQWTKLDTTWTGVPVDALLAEVAPQGATHLVAHCAGGYTTNLPLDDVTGGKAWIAYEYEGEPLSPPTAARRACSSPTSTSGRAPSGSASSSCCAEDHPGYWEVNGYHLRGDPWREQRYDDD